MHVLTVWVWSCTNLIWEKHLSNWFFIFLALLGWQTSPHTLIMVNLDTSSWFHLISRKDLFLLVLFMEISNVIIGYYLFMATIAWLVERIDLPHPFKGTIPLIDSLYVILLPLNIILPSLFGIVDGPPHYINSPFSFSKRTNFSSAITPSIFS